MNYTRVLRAFGGHPQPSVMPVDLAMCLSLGRQQPLSPPLLPVKPPHRYCPPADTLLRTGLHSSSFSTSPLPSSEPRSCFRRDGGGGSANKKRVVFADALGLALTAVRLFIPEPSGSSSSPSFSSTTSASSLVRLQDQESTSDTLQRYRLRPGFQQPTQDFKAFLTRLRDTRVQLESCVVKDRSMSGKVCVFHDGTERAVYIKVTFDSWRSYHDVPCSLLQQQRGGGGVNSEVAVYAFDLSLPQNLDPKDRVEFCVSFRPGPGTAPYWDDNAGQNYRLCMERDARNGSQGDANQRYTTLLSKKRSSFRATHHAADLQRSLSNRVRTDLKHLCSAK